MWNLRKYSTPDAAAAQAHGRIEALPAHDEPAPRASALFLIADLLKRLILSRCGMRAGLRYRRTMPGYRTRATQWSRAAFGIAVLFASLGLWGFDGAWALAGLSVLAALYFRFTGRRSRLPDPALMLQRAQELSADGRTAEAIRLLDDTIRITPWFEEARQYRRELEGVPR
jgi:hypothetical protein